jgi:predicted enzyme related to lactoylglutathione lyase
VSTAAVDLKLEAISVPVSDVERAKAFYERLGWRLDADFRDGAQRAVQLTPPGSPCSIHFAPGAPAAAPGSPPRGILVVSDIEAAREDLAKRGAEVGEIFHYARGPAPFGGQVAGLAPGRQSYGSYATFSDPDGNVWLLQEVTARFPGRVVGETSYTSASDLAKAMKRAEAAHGAYEKTLGKRDEAWADWYADYMVREQSGGS